MRAFVCVRGVLAPPPRAVRASRAAECEKERARENDRARERERAREEGVNSNAKGTNHTQAIDAVGADAQVVAAGEEGEGAAISSDAMLSNAPPPPPPPYPLDGAARRLIHRQVCNLICLQLDLSVQ
ncbi:hypothetical protein T492DRAFT_843004 [Pavlovales sp. CCMP2436]|nr:hypothetical protein T492DRAFT_843004 [Pavlovales sp. CCMP2436]